MVTWYAIKIAVLWVVLIILIWMGSKWFSDQIEEFVVVRPEEGVSCIVVSRAFNTSVDCWYDK